MATICFYFQVHQPCRLRRYTVFDSTPNYFDDQTNARIMKKVAAKCYIPANALLLKLIAKHKAKFRVAFSITGTALEQMQAWAPEALESFQALAATGCVEFLCETHYHSLSVLYSHAEFKAQTLKHQSTIETLFGQSPKVFRNTELIYSNVIAEQIAKLGFIGTLAEGWPAILGNHSPGQLQASVSGDLKLLLRNFELSDDITFRFSNQAWEHFPLTAAKFARRVTEKSAGPLCNLFMDYETFGEHQWEQGGIFGFLEKLPAALLKARHTFATPTQIMQAHEPAHRLDARTAVSWADTARDLSAWMGNAMQTGTLQELYRLETQVKAAGDEKLLDDFRKLTTSDHVYYMCTKHLGDGEVHAYFNPYDSPYDAYIYMMNVLDNLRARLRTG